MSSRILDIAAGVVADLGRTLWSQTLQAQRMYVPRHELKDLATTTVTVVPKALQSELLDRATFQTDYLVDVTVQKHLDTVDDAQVDAMMGLVQEIVDHWRMRALKIGVADAVCVAVAHDPVYSVEHLSTMQVFTGVLTMTFRLFERGA
jgi:hypothetical protein